ncbi:hypothetical protein MJO29_008885 [Puccinia striiformis f. sp. tritici]|nr:hypothetical protein MJO29_008885 [Puccinia striiformis f. sp. tritici]
MISSIQEAFKMILSVVYVCPVCKLSFEALTAGIPHLLDSLQHEDELAHYQNARKKKTKTNKNN